jgi:hypothetical protein
MIRIKKGVFFKRMGTKTLETRLAGNGLGFSLG